MSVFLLGTPVLFEMGSLLVYGSGQFAPPAGQGLRENVPPAGLGQQAQAPPGGFALRDSVPPAGH